MRFILKYSVVGSTMLWLWDLAESVCWTLLSSPSSWRGTWSPAWASELGLQPRRACKGAEWQRDEPETAASQFGCAARQTMTWQQCEFISNKLQILTQSCLDVIYSLLSSNMLIYFINYIYTIKIIKFIFTFLWFLIQFYHWFIYYHFLFFCTKISSVLKAILPLPPFF